MNRINLISLGVRDMPRSLMFYKSIGFQTHETENNPAIVFFNNGGSRLELYPLEGLTRDIDETNPPKLISGGFYGITLAINLHSEQEVDDFMASVPKMAERW